MEHGARHIIGPGCRVGGTSPRYHHVTDDKVRLAVASRAPEHSSPAPSHEDRLKHGMAVVEAEALVTGMTFYALLVLLCFRDVC